MHGRVKVRTTQEQEAAKEKKRREKLQQYRLAMGAIQEMRSNGVHNEDGLQLTENLLTNNPDIYTLWNYRREILQDFATKEDEDAMGERAKLELKITEVCLRANPKSYGAWHHRCWVLENMPKADWAAEVELCDKYLQLDERNFHCWDYRKFVVSHAKVPFKDEFDFTTRKINSNFSNYSAWHYRSRLLSYNDNGELDSSKLPPVSEFDLVNNAVFTDPGDQSAWIYERWLLGKVVMPLSIERAGFYGKKGIVAFSRAISLTADENDTSADYFLQLYYTNDNGKHENIPTTIEGVSGQKHSTVYTFSCDGLDEAVRDSPFCLVITDLNTGKEIQPPISLDYNDRLMNFATSRPIFSDRVRESSRDAVMNVYSSCKDLISMEPDSKWAHLTALTTMLILNKHEMQDGILQEIEELKRIDPKRRNYYNDLRSRVLMECALERISADTIEFNLSNKGITSIYHTQYLCFMRHVDLSKNKIGGSLACLAALQSCESLNLDENELENLKGFPPMPALQKLSLMNNLLEDMNEVLEKTKSCKALVYLITEGNPFNEKLP